MKTYIAIALCFGLSACATNAKFQTFVKGFRDGPAQNVVDSLGYPRRQFKAPNGNDVWEYSSQGSIQMPVTTNYQTNYQAYGNTGYINTTATTTGGQRIMLGCTIWFEMTQDKPPVVAHVRWQGNNCVSR